MSLPASRLLVVAGVLALGAVAVALVAQYGFDMQPCPWCVLQRLLYIVLGVLALAAAGLGGATRRFLAGLAALAALAGIASALWQQLVAASQDSCDLTLAGRIVSGLHLDRLVPQVFIAYASCAEAAVNVFGIPFAVWSCAMFMLCTGLVARALRAA